MRFQSIMSNKPEPQKVNHFIFEVLWTCCQKHTKPFGISVYHFNCVLFSGIPVFPMLDYKIVLGRWFAVPFKSRGRSLDKFITIIHQPEILGVSFWIPGLVNCPITMERSTIFSWENPLFLWPFSIAICMFTRPGSYPGPNHHSAVTSQFSRHSR